MMEVAEREYQFSDERREIKVSIIMPVYKVENYVAKAIESIQNQTLTDFEFLIVDDGTPDRSGEICDQYAERDPRITVIHKENSGAPSARNIAIDMAKGKYLYFLDSDDWAEPMMLEELYNLAEINYAQHCESLYARACVSVNVPEFTLSVIERNACRVDRNFTESFFIVCVCHDNTPFLN